MNEICPKCGQAINAGTNLVNKRWSKKSKAERLKVGEFLTQARKRAIVLRKQRAG